MEDPSTSAQRFLLDLSVEEKSRLYNDLLAIKDVDACMKDRSFYTFRKLRRAAKRQSECRKRTFHYLTQNNHELVIKQIHEQKLFKHHYRLLVTFDQQEFSYTFVETLLNLLHSQHFNLGHQMAYA